MTNDPKPETIRIAVFEDDEDGIGVEIPYDNLALDPNEPEVLSRRRSVEHGVVTDIATEFAATANRPASFPAALPFLAGYRAFTNESPSGTMSTGARWLCDDPDATIAALRDASIADGWTVVVDPLPGALGEQSPVAVLTRGNVTRIFTIHHVGDTRMASLHDIPDI